MDPPAPAVWHRIAIGDRGTVPVTVVKDYGSCIQVLYETPGFRQFAWVKRSDFVPAPPLVP